MSDILEKQLREERESPAGLALAPFGLHPVHQGGGLINFEGTRPDGRRVCVIEDIEGGGYGPRTLDQPVIEYDLATDTERAFPSLSAYLLTLDAKRPSHSFVATRIARLSALRRGNLKRRLLDRCEEAETRHGSDSPQHVRALAVLGRFSALTAN